MQLGRITAYAALGTAFGAVGASLYSELELTEVHSAFQWIAASVVLWLGLGTAGWVPAMAGLDRALAPLAGRVARLRTSLSAAGAEAALVAGLAWGLTPCAMVYGAIFNSLLVGDALQGGIMMFFFGLGTVPAVTATALGLHQASRGSFRMGREWSGMLMVSGGAVGLLLTVPGSPLCISG
jgi:sulfite exporter TauE/SafE